MVVCKYAIRLSNVNFSCASLACPIELTIVRIACSKKQLISSHQFARRILLEDVQVPCTPGTRRRTDDLALDGIPTPTELNVPLSLHHESSLSCFYYCCMQSFRILWFFRILWSFSIDAVAATVTRRSGATLFAYKHLGSAC